MILNKNVLKIKTKKPRKKKNNFKKAPSNNTFFPYYHNSYIISIRIKYQRYVRYLTPNSNNFLFIIFHNTSNSIYNTKQEIIKESNPENSLRIIIKNIFLFFFITKLSNYFSL